MEQRIAEGNTNDGLAGDAVSNLDPVFLADMEKVVIALREAGLEPFDQLIGYVLTGNPLYITSRGNARSIATDMGQQKIRDFLTQNDKWPKNLH